MRIDLCASPCLTPGADVIVYISQNLYQNPLNCNITALPLYTTTYCAQLSSPSYCTPTWLVTRPMTNAPSSPLLLKLSNAAST